jgi:hypothetical protein
MNSECSLIDGLQTCDLAHNKWISAVEEGHMGYAYAMFLIPDQSYQSSQHVIKDGNRIK